MLPVVNSAGLFFSFCLFIIIIFSSFLLSSLKLVLVPWLHYCRNSARTEKRKHKKRTALYFRKAKQINKSYEASLGTDVLFLFCWKHILSPSFRSSFLCQLGAATASPWRWLYWSLHLWRLLHLQIHWVNVRWAVLIAARFYPVMLETGKSSHWGEAYI